MFIKWGFKIKLLFLGTSLSTSFPPETFRIHRLSYSLGVFLSDPVNPSKNCDSVLPFFNPGPTGAQTTTSHLVYCRRHFTFSLGQGTILIQLCRKIIRQPPHAV